MIQSTHFLSSTQEVGHSSITVKNTQMTSCNKTRTLNSNPTAPERKNESSARKRQDHQTNRKLFRKLPISWKLLKHANVIAFSTLRRHKILLVLSTILIRHHHSQETGVRAIENGSDCRLTIMDFVRDGFIFMFHREIPLTNMHNGQKAYKILLRQWNRNHC